MELELKNITKNYDDICVLDNISCRLSPGVYGLLGANGAGKTTLFRTICGLLKPNRGMVVYNKRDIAQDTTDYRSILGFLPQDFRYYPEFTGIKFMLYIASLKGLTGKTARNRCAKLIKLVGLEEVADKKISKYSGGMKQRLGIAQALINDPEILILDEPTVGLDPKERVRFRNLISSLGTDKIVLLSTHIVSDVAYIADEILILKAGKLEDRGTPDSLVQEIQGDVWECLVPMKKVTDMTRKFTVSNQRHEENGVVLRIVSLVKPTENAKQVEPTLEDLYLYYFREGVVT